MENKYGYLTVLKIVRTYKDGRRYVLCSCDCGTSKVIRLNDMQSGRIKSCGDIKKDTAYKLPTGVANFRYLFREYQASAKRKGNSFNLSRKRFAILTRGNCYYCGDIPRRVKKWRGLNGGYVYNGIDRLNNKLGYSVKNSVSCCYDCNFLKGPRNSIDFLKKVRAISINRRFV